jgi:hypothetical protein
MHQVETSRKNNVGSGYVNKSFEMVDTSRHTNNSTQNLPETV